MTTLRAVFVVIACGLTLSALFDTAPKCNGEIHRKHSWNRWCLPGYDYGRDKDAVLSRAVATADPVRQVSLGGTSTVVRRKTFHFPVRQLTSGPVRLENVGLDLYSTGELYATGRLVNEGGPDGDLLGSQVRIRLFAYTGLAGQPGQLADAPVVWQDESRTWVTRNDPKVIDLNHRAFQPVVDRGPTQQTERLPSVADKLLQRHFDQITHLEVELAYLGDR